MDDSLESMRLLDILNNDGNWNRDLVNSIFLPIDATLILNIPRRGSGRRDEISWKPRPKSSSFGVKVVGEYGVVGVDVSPGSGSSIGMHPE
ncbi:hypothetical protein E5676_scaffold1154G00460 [Cucumis melo var. makuwa]|uniref:Uncharacterized protein n=1 Tax=Cucumis melo var. makuwa TaxID=1194695 RepID=A0A5A7UBZ8_CUCMM|nr:hypothetical protein E6C27_scaffold511G00020 [Cucumis melo var. makuwa]TYK02743.1 hypothetical protein E5676_scaffold1154G00460 [Cucumis melo var. makuwa]